MGKNMKVWTEKHQLIMPKAKSAGRTPGLHISSVIRDLAFDGGVLDEKYDVETILEEQDTNMMQLGFAAEDYIEAYHHPEINFHPGEFYIDTDVCRICGDRKCDEGNLFHDDNQGHKFKKLRIYMSPDGLSMIDGEEYPDLITYSDNFIIELKFTKKSCRDFAQLLRTRSKKCLMWLWQIMAYCKACHTLAAKLQVWFVNSDYAWLRGESSEEDSVAPYKVFRIQFEQGEVDQNWSMLVSHAQEMIRNGKYVAA